MPDEFWTTQEFNTPQKTPGEFEKPVFETPNFREPTGGSLIDWDSLRVKVRARRSR